MDYYIIGYFLTFLGFILTTGAQIFIQYAYNKYLKVENQRGLTGAEAARYILDKNNLDNVKITKINGYLSDHYDPRDKQIRLSTKVYQESSIASVAVACHECGHAIQDKEGYTFLRLRSKMAPIVNFASIGGYISLVLGCLLASLDLIWLGIILELVILLFQVITLPVEINASKRALRELDYAHLLNSKELSNSKTVLTAAALTYVASVATTFLEILRLVLVFLPHDDR